MTSPSYILIMKYHAEYSVNWSVEQKTNKAYFTVDKIGYLYLSSVPKQIDLCKQWDCLYKYSI